MDCDVETVASAGVSDAAEAAETTAKTTTTETDANTGEATKQQSATAKSTEDENKSEVAATAKESVGEEVKEEITKSSQNEEESAVDETTTLDKPIEADLDSSIILLESPVQSAADGESEAIEEVTDEVTPPEEEHSLKQDTVASDSSVELIDSPSKAAAKAASEKEEIKELERVEMETEDVKSDDSVELISSTQETTEEKEDVSDKDQVTENIAKDPEPTEAEQKAADVDSDNSVELISSPRKIAKMEIDEQQSDAAITEMDENKETSQEDENQEPSKIEPMDICEQSSESKDINQEDNCLLEPNTAPIEEKACAADLNEDYGVYYNKDCLNCNCGRLHKQYMLATLAVLNFYKVPRKMHKRQYVCMGCFDAALDVYEDYAGYLLAKQPLLLREFKQENADFVALDSSEDEETDDQPDKGEFSTDDLALIEEELEAAVSNVLERVGMSDQMAWSHTILQAKSDRIGRDIELANVELSKLQNMADKMHFALYNSCQVVHKHMPPLDVYHNNSDFVQVPPAGEIERPPIQLNETYYAVKNKAIASWVSVKVVEFTESTAVGGNIMKSYKIRYLNSPYHMVKTITAKHLAYFEPPPVRLTIGTRVIAFFDGSTLSRGKAMVQSAFYPGIIAEPLKQANGFRYLIFYDDGYTQYVQHNDVRLVCQTSERVWEDVHPGSRDFIQKYIEKYSVNRPMVQCTRGQSMNTESNGTWLYARVMDIDCSLVLMQFDDDKNHTEWIYRGSLRLGPVFKETQNALNSANAMQQHRLRRTIPFIRYTEEMESSSRQVQQQKRDKARKSSAAPQQIEMQAPASDSSPCSSAAAAAASATGKTVRHLNNSTIYVDDENRPKGNVVYFTAKRNLPPKMYTPHECWPGCLFKIVHRLDSYSPLAKPLLSGWERLVFKQKTKRNVVYRGPCGKSLRNLDEVHRYLRATENVLNVENFDFTPDLRCLAEYTIDKRIVKEADISHGQEKMAIPLVNYYDNTLPPPCTYASQRIPTEGVHLNVDEEFLVGCDCEDDCSDKSKCACWQLTVAGVRYCNPNKPIEEIGYQYKRLHEHVPTGIYECNSRCKCKQNCLNRVVQHSLEMKLQVFKTSNRGWGLRCVNDIPKGAFICIYAGHLLTETKANEGGLDAGDEYFADLDYIEVAEQLKEGYESDVEHSPAEEDEEPYVPDPEDDDDEFTPKKYYQPRKKDKLMRVSRRNSNPVNVQDSQERAVINFNPNADMDETVRENSVRRLFGKEEAPYIMDAKTTGNLGRYFNHSCAPNLFVQNVFVDTHDLRFPWVAFFSANHIRSGTELTWNYNYEVGVVAGKVLYCQCGAANCRIRLL